MGVCYVMLSDGRVCYDTGRHLWAKIFMTDSSSADKVPHYHRNTQGIPFLFHDSFRFKRSAWDLFIEFAL